MPKPILFQKKPILFNGDLMVIRKPILFFENRYFVTKGNGEKPILFNGDLMVILKRHFSYSSALFNGDFRL